MARYEVRGGDDVRAMLDRHSGRELHKRLRRGVRAGGKVMQAGLKVAAAAEPTGNLPDSFKNVPAPKVSASSRLGGDIVARVRPKSPLFNIFEPGADQHEITGSFLIGDAGEGQNWTAEGRKRKGPFVGGRRVTHPGMKARPILPTAFDSSKVAARHAIALVLFEGPG